MGKWKKKPYHRHSYGRNPVKAGKPPTPYRVVTHGSLNHTVEKYLRSRGYYSDFHEYEQVAWCTSNQIARQIYNRLTVEYVEATLR